MSTLHLRNSCSLCLVIEEVFFFFKENPNLYKIVSEKNQV